MGTRSTDSDDYLVLSRAETIESKRLPHTHNRDMPRPWKAFAAVALPGLALSVAVYAYAAAPSTITTSGAVVPHAPVGSVVHRTALSWTSVPPAYLPGGSIYQSQVPPLAWGTPSSAPALDRRGASVCGGGHVPSAARAH